MTIESVFKIWNIDSQTQSIGLQTDPNRPGSGPGKAATAGDRVGL